MTTFNKDSDGCDRAEVARALIYTFSPPRCSGKCLLLVYRHRACSFIADAHDM